jgi:hypothetical protein
MSMTRIIAIALCALALAACVRTSSSMIGPNMAIISGRGTAFDTTAGVSGGTIKEAARITLSHGFRYFAVVAAQNKDRRGMAYLPGQTYTSGNVTASGNTATWSGNSYTTPGSTVGFIKPGMDVTIKMFHEGEIDPHADGVMDATQFANP